MGIRHHTGARPTFRCPLMRACRALRQLPLVAEQVRKKVIAPLRRPRGPKHFYPAADRIAALAAAKRALPAEALLLNARGFRFGAHQSRITGAVRFAEGVAAGNQRDGLFIVHRHTPEGLANILSRGNLVPLGRWALRYSYRSAPS